MCGNTQKHQRWVHAPWRTRSQVLAKHASQPGTTSREAEFYGVVKGAGVGLGQQALLRDIGIELPVRVWTDSIAAIGICGRQGLGKLRHLACQSLWIQQKVRTNEIELRKVRGDCNPADLFTKFMDSQGKLNKLVGLFGCEFRSGRSGKAPTLRRKAVAEVQQTSTEEGRAPQHDIGNLDQELSDEMIEFSNSGTSRCRITTLDDYLTS